MYSFYGVTPMLDRMLPFPLVYSFQVENRDIPRVYSFHMPN